MERKIWLLPLFFFLALWLGGCSMQYAPEELESWDGDLSLLLKVSTGDQGKVGTRALNDGDGFEEPFLASEKIQSLRIIIVNNGNTDGSKDPLMGQIVYNRHVTSRPELSIGGIPELKFKVDFSKKYRVYLIANEAGIPDKNIHQKLRTVFAEGWFYPDPGSQLEDMIISAPEAGMPFINNIGVQSKLQKPVPMTEFYDITTMDKPEVITEEDLTQTENFFITRAASKFSFTIKKGSYVQEGDSYSPIGYIKITGLGSKEYLFPKGTDYSPPKDKESTNYLGGREITEFAIPEEDNPVGDYIFELSEDVEVSGLDDNGYPFSPELYFTESKPKKFECSISYDGVHFVPAKILNNPNLQNLPRNTHVKVNITIKAYSIEATVSVLPYTGVWLEPTFGIDRD